jgi:hypothetical protein
MISHAMYDVLKGMSTTEPMKVTRLWGKYNWQSISEGAVEKLVRLQAVRSALVGDELHFWPTPKAEGLMREYEQAHTGRKQRGRSSSD